jgi:hypothetical protein
MRLGYVGLWVDHDFGRNGLFLLDPKFFLI